jgi:hypothetical protein
MLCINSDKNGLGYCLGDFFTNSSGHPVQNELEFDAEMHKPWLRFWCVTFTRDAQRGIKAMPEIMNWSQVNSFCRNLFNTIHMCIHIRSCKQNIIVSLTNWQKPTFQHFSHCTLQYNRLTNYKILSLLYLEAILINVGCMHQLQRNILL